MCVGDREHKFFILRLLTTKCIFYLGVVAYIFNPSSGGRGRQIFGFEASLVCMVNSRTARDILKDQSPFLKKKK